MHTLRTLRRLFGWSLLLVACQVIQAQDTDIDDLAKRPAPTPAPSAVPDGGLDIESLREPGSTAKLFPDQPAATPVPENGAAGPGGRRGRGQGQGGVLGRKRNSGRRRDVLVDQADTDPLMVRVAYRRAKTVAMTRDPGLAVLLRAAADASTDPEKRAFLKQYYTRLYDSVGRIDRSPEMKKHLETLRLVATSRYDPKRREVGGDEDLVLGRGGGRRGGGRNR